MHTQEGHEPRGGAAGAAACRDRNLPAVACLPRLPPTALARMLSPPVMLLALLVMLDGVCLAVEAGLLKPSPQQLKYADQELGAL